MTYIFRPDIIGRRKKTIVIGLDYTLIFEKADGNILPRPHLPKFFENLEAHFNFVLWAERPLDEAIQMIEKVQLREWFCLILGSEHLKQERVNGDFVPVKDLEVIWDILEEDGFMYNRENTLMVDHNVKVTNIYFPKEGLKLRMFRGNEEDSELSDLQNYLEDNISMVKNLKEVTYTNWRFDDEEENEDI